MEHNISAQLERFKDSFLVAAAKAGSAQEVQSLLEMGADVSWRSSDGNLGDTALLAAVRNGHRDVASILLAMGADPTDATSILPGAENFGGDTTLHLACRRGDEVLATLLIEAAAAECADHKHEGALAQPILHKRRAADGMTAFEAAEASGYGGMARRLKNFAECIVVRHNGTSKANNAVCGTDYDRRFGLPALERLSTQSQSNVGADVAPARNIVEHQSAEEGNLVQHSPSLGNAPDPSGSISNASAREARDDAREDRRDLGQGSQGIRHLKPHVDASMDASSGTYDNFHEDGLDILDEANAQNTDEQSHLPRDGTDNAGSSLVTDITDHRDAVSQLIVSNSPPLPPLTLDDESSEGASQNISSERNCTVETERDVENSKRNQWRGMTALLAGTAGCESSLSVSPRSSSSVERDGDFQSSPQTGLSQTGLRSGPGRRKVGEEELFQTTLAAAVAENVDKKNENMGTVAFRELKPKQQMDVIRTIWLSQKTDTETANAKAGAAREQSARLWTDLMDLQSDIGKLQSERDDASAELRRMQGLDLESLNLEQLDRAESMVKDALDRIATAKKKIVDERFKNIHEQRMCIVCQEREKSTLLMPCRHLCLCSVCSGREELRNCPLCRSEISDRIPVYS